jgi:PPOX class probable F420-dependent enzyme
MAKMTTEEIYAFLKGHPYTGHLATVREDGRPHVAAIWIIVDGEDILFTTWHTSVKGRNLQRTGYAALSVDDSTPPFTAVQVEGPVEMISDPAESHKWAGIIGGRYMGADRAQEFADRNGVEGEWLCRMRPVKLSGIAAITD